MGYNRNIPTAVAFGPPNMGGMGMRHLFSEQGTIKVMTILQQLCINKRIGHTIQIKLQWAQHIAGTQRSIYRHPGIQIPQLDQEKWARTLREFLHKSDLSIHVCAMPERQPKRTHDQFIMDLTDDFTNNQIQQINRCRVYLRVETVADLSNAMGTHLIPDIDKCLPHTRAYLIDLWPVQERPGKNHRSIWRKFLTTIAHPDGTLRRRLGRWTSATTKRDWDAYYDPKTNTALAKDEHSQHMMRYELGSCDRRGRQIHNPIHANNWYHRQLVPADRHHSTEIKQIQWTGPPNEGKPANRTTHRSWRQYKQSLDTWERNLLRHERRNRKHHLFSTLCSINGALHIVYDGSVHHNIGTYAWTMANDTRILYSGSGIAHGSPMTPFRAEAYAKLAAITFLNHYQSHTKTPIQCKIHQYTNNHQLMRTTHSSQRYNRAYEKTTADYDIISAIRNAQDKLKSTAQQYTETAYVRGHQDQRIPKAQWTWPEKLHIHCDREAANRYHSIKRRVPDNPTDNAIPTGHAYIINNKQLVTSDERQTLQWSWATKQLQHYYQKKHNLTKTVLQTIDWTAYGRARTRTTFPPRHFSTKLLIGWLPTGDRLKKCGANSDTCPTCHHEETNEHIFHCQHWTTQNAHYLQTLEDTLTNINTHPYVTTAMMAGAHQWLQHAPMSMKYFVPTEMRKCYSSQSKIGWHMLARGIISQQWSQQYELYKPLTKKTTSNITKEQWSATIVRTLLRLAHERWIARNQIVHQQDTAAYIARKTAEIHAQVTWIYGYKDQLLPADQAILDMPLNERLQQPLDSLNDWVITTIPTVRRLARTQQSELTRSTNDIRNYFTTHPDGQANQHTSAAGAPNLARPRPKKQRKQRAKHTAPKPSKKKETKSTPQATMQAVKRSSNTPNVPMATASTAHKTPSKGKKRRTVKCYDIRAMFHRQRHRTNTVIATTTIPIHATTVDKTPPASPFQPPIIHKTPTQTHRKHKAKNRTSKGWQEKPTQPNTQQSAPGGKP